MTECKKCFVLSNANLKKIHSGYTRGPARKAGTKQREKNFSGREEKVFMQSADDVSETCLVCVSVYVSNSY